MWRYSLGLKNRMVEGEVVRLVDQKKLQKNDQM